jgi:hypothetical protein
MTPFRVDPRWAHGWPSAGLAGVRLGLRWASHHTGLPLILVAAIALVLSWRLLKRGVRLAAEVAFALALLLVATRLGWVTW